MANTIKAQAEILEKLNIHSLHPMQEEAIDVIKKSPNTILLSPTGTGKTLAFLLPVIDQLDAEIEAVQALILVPSRELAIQIEQVLRQMGTGFKVNALYGGRAMAKDKQDLQHAPAILIGTPGRIADHFRSERFSSEHLTSLVLDEFDKSLETGFESEIRFIINQLPKLKNRILTSATQSLKIPGFVGLNQPQVINYLDQKKSSKLSLKTVISSSKNKLPRLVELVNYLGGQPGIVFCNFRESIDQVSNYLKHKGISHACFSGGMEQKDRERALIKFRNGSSQLLIATDLAARGIDIPELKFIIHYELPQTEAEFTHRNGRTARVDAKGTAFIIKWEKESLPEFIKAPQVSLDQGKTASKKQFWETLFISGGRKDKISKGDIAGLFFKQGKLNSDQLGNIELKQDCAFVAVPYNLADTLVEQLTDTRLKKKKVRIYRLD